MIVWPAKDPLEVLDFTWTVPLDAGDSILSHTATVTGANKNSSAAQAGQVVVWISGGVTGVNASAALSVTTTQGRTFRETAVLPIFDRASELLANFRIRYPAFAAVADGTIGYWLNDAGAHDNWPIEYRDTARLLLTAHNLAGNAAGAIPGGVTSFKSGTFSASISDSAASRTGFSASLYGRDYLALMRRHYAGPRLAWNPPANV